MNGQASTATGYSPCLMAKFRSAMSLLAEAVSRLSVRMFSIGCWMLDVDRQERRSMSQRMVILLGESDVGGAGRAVSSANRDTEIGIAG